MGLYNLGCVSCHKTFLWFSGNPDQRCAECKIICEWNDCHRTIGEIMGAPLGEKNKPQSVAASFHILRKERNDAMADMDHWRDRALKAELSALRAMKDTLECEDCGAQIVKY